METKGFAHIDAMRSSSRAPASGTLFPRPVPAPSLRCRGRSETAQLFQTGCRLNSKACTEWRRISRRKRSCVDALVKPNKHAIDQRQRLPANPSGLRLPPIRQNASAKVIGVWKSTDCILISRKPLGLKSYIVIGEKDDISLEFRHCSIPSMGEALPIFCDAADWQPFPKVFHNACRCHRCSYYQPLALLLRLDRYSSAQQASPTCDEGFRCDYMCKYKQRSRCAQCECAKSVLQSVRAHLALPSLSSACTIIRTTSGMV